EELYRLFKERVDVFVVEQEGPYSEIDKYDQQVIHYFLKDSESIVALVRLLPAGSRYKKPSIRRVLVTEKYRGHGYARDIMNKAVKDIQEEWNEEEMKLQAQDYLEKCNYS